MNDTIPCQSLSSIKLFETCPKKFYHLRVVKDFKEDSGSAAEWGTYVHLQLENYLMDGTPLPLNVAMYQKYADAVKRRPGTLFCEMEAAVTQDWQPTGFWEPDAWMRGKIDVVILNGDCAEVLDWKTGKRKDDPSQLQLYAAKIMSKFPEVNHVRSGFVWLVDGGVTPPYNFSRDALPSYKQEWATRWGRLEDAYMSGQWRAKPSGLCRGWCPVASCPHWRPKV